MHEKELFSNYEFDNSSWKKAIFSLIGGSIIFHIIILLFLVYVPAVRDAFYIALLFSDAPTGWVNKDYNKTGIEEDTASIISLPPSDQLQYPAGYFNLANGNAPAPDLTASTTPPAPEVPIPNDGEIPGFPGLTLGQPKATPTPFPVSPGFNPVPLPKLTSRRLPPKLKIKPGATPPPLEEVNGKNGGISQPSPTPKTEEIANASPSPTPDMTKSGNINQKPLQDLAAKAIKQINDKEIDLTKSVNVTIKGVLDDKGKLIAKQTSYKNNGGDEKLASMAAELISAMNDSNMLTYVQALCGDKKQCDVNFNLSKDEKDVKFQVVSVAGDNAKANSIASGLNFGFNMYKGMKSGTEEGDLLNDIKVTTDKNQVIINWQMDAPTAMRKIQNKLIKVAAEQQSKPTSVVPTNPNAEAAIE